MVYCKVLGSIRVFDADEDELTLTSESQRRLLALLCLHARTVVRSSVLEEHLGLSSGALRTSISRLRRATDPECLVTGHAGYELRADVDVGEYERLVIAADAASAEQARCDLEQARAIWNGGPYDEFAGEPWADVEVRRLTELHAAAMEELVVILLDAGEEAAAMVELVPLIDEHPYRDRPQALLLRALNQAGRTTEALREFQAYRSVLHEDIGTEPSAALVELDRFIATGSDVELLRQRGHPAWTRHRESRQRVALYSDPRLRTPRHTSIGRDRAADELLALIGSGLTGATRAVTDRAAELLADMRAAPPLTTALHLAKSQLALARGDLGLAKEAALAALDAAQSNRLLLAVIDALELSASVSGRSDDVLESRLLARRDQAERVRLSARFASTGSPRPAPPTRITAS